MEMVSVTKIEYKTNYLDLTSEEIDFLVGSMAPVENQQISGSAVYYMDSCVLEEELNDPELSSNERDLLSSIIRKCEEKEGQEFAFHIIFN
jgi:hypothetical protein